MAQEPEEDVVEDPEWMCDKCQMWGQVCMWPRRNRQKACLQCTGKCFKCMQDGESVTQCALQRTGTSPNKRYQVTTLEILESEGDVVVVQKTPKGSTKEQLLWRIVCALEQLVGEQASFHEEMARIQEFSERTEKILQELVDQTKASSDTMELFMQGEHFVRTREMGKLEGS